jgi:hypothetical protein
LRPVLLSQDNKALILAVMIDELEPSTHATMARFTAGCAIVSLRVCNDAMVSSRIQSISADS